MVSTGGTIVVIVLQGGRCCDWNLNVLMMRKRAKRGGLGALSLSISSPCSLYVERFTTTFTMIILL